MPEACDDKSAPRTARKLPVACKRDCHFCSAAVMVDTVWGAVAAAPMYLLIILAMKVCQPKMPPNMSATARPRMTSGLIIALRGAIFAPSAAFPDSSVLTIAPLHQALN